MKLIGLLALIVIVSGCIGANDDLPKPEIDLELQVEDSLETERPSNLIQINDNGYNPSILRVSTGTTVTFENIGSRDNWPASDNHPTHKVYPNSDISKCGTDEAENIFDVCGALNPGETYSFTFDEIGEWKYHDHLRPSMTGIIVVE